MKYLTSRKLSFSALVSRIIPANQIPTLASRFAEYAIKVNKKLGNTEIPIRMHVIKWPNT